ncbi:hypothetical protein SAMN04489812_0916 [Microlunatus soli]|uniref:Uncharacterized protein n=1 Tax=Microlunatus soli TaxID=630515 RepID=A0A1H1PIM2_9ACTN|nr:hypothetical protein SAMN04489812_0916 [Microlunatus soli]
MSQEADPVAGETVEPEEPYPQGEWSDDAPDLVIADSHDASERSDQ